MQIQEVRRECTNKLGVAKWADRNDWEVSLIRSPLEHVVKVSHLRSLLGPQFGLAEMLVPILVLVFYFAAFKCNYRFSNWRPLFSAATTASPRLFSIFRLVRVSEYSIQKASPRKQRSNDEIFRTETGIHHAANFLPRNNFIKHLWEES